MATSPRIPENSTRLHPRSQGSIAWNCSAPNLRHSGWVVPPTVGQTLASTTFGAMGWDAVHQFQSRSIEQVFEGGGWDFALVWKSGNKM